MLYHPFPLHIPYSNKLPSYISYSDHMGRRRAAESVPEVEDGIEEIVIWHAKTSRGFWTTEKSVPIIVPTKEKSGQPSCSKKGKQHELEPNRAEGSGEGVTTMDDTQTHQFMDEQEYDLPDLEPEERQPQANVCSTDFIFIECQLISAIMIDSHGTMDSTPEQISPHPVGDGG